MSFKLFSALAIPVFFAGALAAQDRPLITGTWVQETTGTSPGGPVTLTITDTPASLTIARTVGEDTETVNFSYIGEAEAVRIAEGMKDEIGGATLVQDAKAIWHADRLDTFITRSISGKTVTQQIRYTLDRTLTRLTVGTDLQVQHGYETASAASASAKDVYVKQHYVTQ